MRRAVAVSRGLSVALKLLALVTGGGGAVDVVDVVGEVTDGGVVVVVGAVVSAVVVVGANSDELRDVVDAPAVVGVSVRAVVMDVVVVCAVVCAARPVDAEHDANTSVVALTTKDARTPMEVLWVRRANRMRLVRPFTTAVVPRSMAFHYRGREQRPPARPCARRGARPGVFVWHTKTNSLPGRLGARRHTRADDQVRPAFHSRILHRCRASAQGLPERRSQNWWRAVSTTNRESARRSYPLRLLGGMSWQVPLGSGGPSR